MAGLRTTSWICVAAMLLSLLWCGCNRNSPQDSDPVRQKLVGKWDSPTDTTCAALDLNADGTFRYQFKTSPSDDRPYTVKGDWIIDDNAIFGQVKSVKNGTYAKVGDTLPIGQIVLVDDNTLKLQKQNGPEIYHRLSK